jgi:DNA-binding winged helix-turn-helix (wHTH) protein
MVIEDKPTFTEHDGNGATQTEKLKYRYVRFGPFELDLVLHVLWNNEKRWSLGQHSYLILAALVERNGETVTREELCSILWPGGAVINYEANINTSLNKIRNLLRDSTNEASDYIETVPRIGYRFEGQVEYADHRQTVYPVAAIADASPVRRFSWISNRTLSLLIASALCLLICGMLMGAAIMALWFVHSTN